MTNPSAKWSFGLRKISDQNMSYSEFLDSLEAFLRKIHRKSVRNFSVRIVGDNDFEDLNLGAEPLIDVVARCIDSSFLGADQYSRLLDGEVRFNLAVKLRFTQLQSGIEIPCEIGVGFNAGLLLSGKNEGKASTSLVCFFDKFDFARCNLFAKELFELAIEHWRFDFGSLVSNSFREAYQQQSVWVEVIPGRFEKKSNYEGTITIGWLTFLRKETFKALANDVKVREIDSGLIFELSGALVEPYTPEVLSSAREVHLFLNDAAIEAGFDMH